MGRSRASKVLAMQAGRLEFRPPVSMATQGSDGGSNSRTHEMETGDAWGRMASKNRPISELWLQVRDSDLLYKVYMQSI